MKRESGRWAANGPSDDGPTDVFEIMTQKYIYICEKVSSPSCLARKILPALVTLISYSMLYTRQILLHIGGNEFYSPPACLRYPEFYG